MAIPVQKSRWEVLRSIRAISQEAWIRASEMADFSHSVDWDEPQSAQVKAKMRDAFWSYYEAVARCALDRSNFEDLAVLSAFWMDANAGDSPRKLEALKSFGSFQARMVESIRDDQGIISAISDLIESSKMLTQNASGGNVPARALPASATPSISSAVHRYLFKDTKALIELDLSGSAEVIAKLSTLFVLLIDKENDALFGTYERAISSAYTFADNNL